ncbi:MAG: D-glycero-beta-D-manno-heptose 1-phosphate adenylyltransferase [Ignavibacteriaceae bacterium]|nr:MAG: D-glycero-beta-D-manno-heptose 1-phosphate adenylyltransferase [Chlorobiota bacterium]KXK05877.1 MAG: Bifunctional sugar kinase/adenylyltransferase [Chlorobi bacterium OLB4]MBV6398295.1 Bifunctional protein HldE [Ignavibacteria bacterium]MCC6886113.1 D-glycero-beta-D-manno-heptose 1-phosphate adenylyltransferase [Ignavibacteriales bacterium]MCE7952635.1 D-glycero-beta-D-manno-heptose 1-phosphate adenylyltransferase [Chlorobi bacterium CHB7]MDL1886747.1 D-glycero-beta-D-manno-heptose 1-
MIHTIESFRPVREFLLKSGRKLVFTNGCFDIIHRGHLEYLNEAKSLGHKLLVGINSDTSVKQLKGADRPVNNELDRAFVIDNLKTVDYVIIFNDETPYNLIKSVKPDILVKGGDWKPDKIVGSDIVIENGGEVKSLSFIDNYSTSAIVKKIIASSSNER